MMDNIFNFTNWSAFVEDAETEAWEVENELLQIVKEMVQDNKEY